MGMGRNKDPAPLCPQPGCGKKLIRCKILQPRDPNYGRSYDICSRCYLRFWLDEEAFNMLRDVDTVTPTTTPSPPPPPNTLPNPRRASTPIARRGSMSRASSVPPHLASGNTARRSSTPLGHAQPRQPQQYQPSSGGGGGRLPLPTREDRAGYRAPASRQRHSSAGSVGGGGPGSVIAHQTALSPPPGVRGRAPSMKGSRPPTPSGFSNAGSATPLPATPLAFRNGLRSPPPAPASIRGGSIRSPTPSVRGGSVRGGFSRPATPLGSEFGGPGPGANDYFGSQPATPTSSHPSFPSRPGTPSGHSTPYTSSRASSMDRSAIYDEDPELEQTAQDPFPAGAEDGGDVGALADSVEQLDMEGVPVDGEGAYGAGAGEAEMMDQGYAGSMAGDAQPDVGGWDQPMSPPPPSTLSPPRSTHLRPQYAQQRPVAAPHQQYRAHHTSPPPTSSFRAPKVVSGNRNNSAPVWQPNRARTNSFSGRENVPNAGGGGNMLSRGLSSWFGGMRSASPTPARQSFAKTWTPGGVGGNPRGPSGAPERSFGGGGGAGGGGGRMMSVGANSYRWGQGGGLIKESPVWGGAAMGGGGAALPGYEGGMQDFGEQGTMAGESGHGDMVDGGEAYHSLPDEYDYGRGDGYPDGFGHSEADAGEENDLESEPHAVPQAEAATEASA